jgi:hypothetical protein
VTYLGAPAYAGGVTETVPTDSGPSNVRMTPAAIDALHKLARPQAESVARAIASIGRVPGNPVEAPNGNGNGNGRQYLAIVPDDEMAPVVMYRESEDNGYLVTALVDRDTYQTYEITEQPSFLRSTTFRTAVGAVAAAAIGIILGSRAGRSSLT